MLKKILLGLSAAATVFCGANALAKVGYDPNQLQQFLQTNQCPGCDLSNAGLYGNHSQANLDKANLSNAAAANMNLSQATLTNANLTNTDFGGSNLSGANFTGSALYGADLGLTNLYQTTISAAQLAQAASVCGAILPDGSKGKCNK